MKTYVIIPAAGKGIRSGFSVPKQYIKFNNKELITYTLEIFQKNRLINEIFIAAHPDYFNRLDKIKRKYDFTKVSKIVKGGKHRQDSVYNALKLIKAEENDLIVVHDAARPLLTQKILTNAVNTARKLGNALVCIKAKDTLIKGTNIVDSYIERENVYYVQTPQVFRYKVLMDAMKSAYASNLYATDESMLVNNLGEKINIVEGSIINFKMTTSDDIDLLRKLLK